MQKTVHFALRFYIQKSEHFALHFYIQKTMHFALRFYLKFILYWYLTINARTIRAIRSKNKFELFIEIWSYSYDK